MTASPRDGRPAPILLHDGIAVPGELCAELASALALLNDFVRGAPPPASCRAQRLSRPAVAVMLAARDAAARHQAREHARQAWAPPTPVTAEVLGTAQPVSVSGVEELTTAQAADIAGYSPEWWRRLAVRGTVRARQDSRRTWLLARADVVGYANRARQENTDGIHGDQDTARPRRQAG